jgi:hypothetical protein
MERGSGWVILPTDAEAVSLNPGIAKEHALSLLEPYPGRSDGAG